MNDDELQVRASALTQQAITRITAEIGPRAIHMEPYSATAQMIVDEVFGDKWDVDFTLDMEGKPHVFVRRYRG